MVFAHITDIDMNNLYFAPMESKDGKQRVELYKDSAVSKHNKLFFNLCEDPTEPFQCRYRLDSVRDESDGSRRGLAVKLQDPTVRDAIAALDDAVVNKAVEHSKEWFKKELTRDQILLRYKPLFLAKEEEEYPILKFKVKCRVVPTKLHFLRSDGFIVPEGASLDHLITGVAHVAPILSVHSVWFMGGGTSFGLTIQAEEMVVRPATPPQPLANFCSRSKRPLQVVKREDDDEAAAALKTSRMDVEDVLLRDDDDVLGGPM